MFQSSQRPTSLGQKNFTLGSSETFVNIYRIHAMTSQNITYVTFTTTYINFKSHTEYKIYQPSKMDLCHWRYRLVCKKSQDVVNAQCFQNSGSEMVLAVQKCQERIQDTIQSKIFVYVMLPKHLCIYCLLFVVNLFHMGKKYSKVQYYVSCLHAIYQLLCM
jgi:hypothetical protein